MTDKNLELISRKFDEHLKTLKKDLIKTSKIEQELSKDILEIYNIIGSKVRIIWNSLIAHESYFKNNISATTLKSVMTSFLQDLSILKKIPDENLIRYTEKMIYNLKSFIEIIFTKDNKISNSFDFQSLKSAFIINIIRPTNELLKNLNSDEKQLAEMSKTLKKIADDKKNLLPHLRKDLAA